MNSDGTRRSYARLRPGRVWYFVAGALFIVFSVISLYVLHAVLTISPAERIFFLAPGRQSIRVDVPGVHTLVYEARTVYAGTQFRTPAKLPEATHVAVTNLTTGGAVAVRLDLKHPLVRFNLRRHKIGDCRIDDPGRYEITVRTAENDELRRVFSFGPSRFWLVVGWLALWAIINFTAFFFGPALAVLVYSRRLKAKRRRGLC